MNTGIFGEGFPYSNFHDLNMDWIIKIAKDFLDQYTNIQNVITAGLNDLEESKDAGLEELDQKRLEGLTQLHEITVDGLEELTRRYNTLESLLREWYNTHSEDIANQLTTAIADFNSAAEAKSQALLDSWPADYSELVTWVNDLKRDLNYVNNGLMLIAGSKNILFTYGHYIRTNQSIGTACDMVVRDSDALAYAVIDCNEGDEFIINGTGSGTARLWCFVDIDNVILDAALADITGTNLKKVAPPNTKKLIINSTIEDLGNCIKGLSAKEYTDKLDGAANRKIDAITTKEQTWDKYLYKNNKYLHNGDEIYSNGINLYKFPFSTGGVVYFSWNENFWGDFNSSYIFVLEKQDDTMIDIPITGNGNEYQVSAANKDALFIDSNGTIKNVYVAFPATNMNKLKFTAFSFSGKEQLFSDYVNIFSTVATIDESNSIVCKYYLNNNGYPQIYSAKECWLVFLKAGDQLVFPHLAESGNNFGRMYDASGNIVTIPGTSLTYTAQVALCGLVIPKSGDNVTIIPAETIKIPYRSLIGINPFEGLTGIAFGTSLTARAYEDHKYQYNTYGYLTYLRQYSGMTIDNQGVGDSTILEAAGKQRMLPVITEYAGYADKDVCILEGFVNDWGANSDKLGTWEDTGTTTVCGCVRYAINYIMSQNANITLFLILDHYGKDSGGVDNSSTAEENGLTQFEFYNEIAKVAESLGVPVIYEYKESQISENTPQYLSDNIHCNNLGAKQSGTFIWNKMRAYNPNVK